MTATPAPPIASRIVRLLTLGEVRALPRWRETLRGAAKDHRYYELIAETLGADFDCRALVVEDADGAVVAIQPCFFVSRISWLRRHARCAGSWARCAAGGRDVCGCGC